MKVYRLETEEGAGPYRAGHCMALGIWTLRCEQHPLPWEDGLDEISSHEVCGFANLDQLCAWFNDSEIRALESRGVFVWEFEIPKGRIRFGRKQIAFDRNQANRVRRI